MAKQFDLNKKRIFDFYFKKSRFISTLLSYNNGNYLGEITSIVLFSICFACERQFALVNCRQHLFPVIQRVKLLCALLLPVTVGMLSHG